MAIEFGMLAVWKDEDGQVNHPVTNDIQTRQYRSPEARKNELSRD